MSTPALPCIVCGSELDNVGIETEVNQPYAGTAFTSYGHYGSTVFDPMDRSHLEINVCDNCLVANAGRARHTLELPSPPQVIFSKTWEPGAES